jgi:hypothetical protein
MFGLVTGGDGPYGNGNSMRAGSSLEIRGWGGQYHMRPVMFLVGPGRS